MLMMMSSSVCYEIKAGLFASLILPSISTVICKITSFVLIQSSLIFLVSTLLVDANVFHLAFSIL